MSKHTPGPWFSEGTRIASMDGTTVIDCMGNMSGEDVWADKRLLVAAPELLEALEGVLPMIEDQAAANSTAFAIYDKARQAIAKAKAV
jgi:hypothetical protein